MTKTSGDPASVAVVGGGIIGSWAALHLAEAGVNTTLYEQFPLPHSRGSSHGLSRAFRFLGELELGRLDYSLQRWQQLEKISGQTLFVKTGLLNFGKEGDPDLATYMGVLKTHARSHAWLDSAEIRRKYPNFNYPADWGAAWDPDGGLLIAQACLAAVQAAFVASGGRIETSRVAALDEAGDAGVQVSCDAPLSGATTSRVFDRAVVCAGPWTGKLLPALRQFLMTQLIPVSYWHDPSDAYSARNGCPIIFNARLTGIYGLPSCEYPRLVKILYHGGPETDPDIRDRASAAEYIHKVRNYVGRYLPALEDSEPGLSETCMYTMTPDSNPVIDHLSERIVVGCGFSGSGFKHAPATGQMLALYALQQDAAVPDSYGAGRYRLQRLQTDSAAT